MPEAAPERGWLRLLRQFASPVIYLLLGALVLDAAVWIAEGAHGWPVASIAIAAILLLNAGFGAWQEGKADQALQALAGLAAPRAWALRDGEWIRVEARALVPGDLVRLASGSRVPADGALVAGQGVEADESLLTGESLPVGKMSGDRMLSGTLVTRGTGLLAVESTGPSSTMGKLASLLDGVVAEPTPLERRMERFGRRVALWVLGLAALVAALGVAVAGIDELPRILLFAVALAVGAVPEGMPAALTLTLALGTQEMAKRKAVVRRLSAVEALGSVTVIATDKTGTLTQNRMEVRRLDVDPPQLSNAVRAMVLASDAGGEFGDPLERALLAHARATGLDVGLLETQTARVSLVPFDSAWKYMRVTVRDAEGRLTSWLKGAPEVLLERCELTPPARRSWQGRLDRAAEKGYRTLGLAMGEGEAEEGLTFLGLVLLWDPPRAEVPDAVRRAREAGIRVVMLTGDHPVTARAIARKVGLPAERVTTGEALDALAAGTLGQIVGRTDVFARVSPDHKLAIVTALQARGEIVAVTGDGVNDAPALKRADVGVAMGERGSAVAREAADVVLLDDNFATIVAAVEEGRSVYENIQKFIRFLFSTNLSDVILVALGALIGLAVGMRDPSGGFFLPLTAVQILWINLVTDSAPALALAMDDNPGLMREGPRSPDAPLLDRASLGFIGFTGGLKGLLAVGLLVSLPALGFDLPATVSLVFTYLVLGQLLFVYPARHLRVTPRRNRLLVAAVLIGALAQVIVVVVPSVGAVLGTQPLSLTGWVVVVVAILVTLVAVELYTQRARTRARAGRSRRV